MKRLIVSCAAATILAGTLIGGPAAAGPREDLEARGAKLFADPALGTNGKSCASCHANAAEWAGKPRFPKFAMGAVRTLDQAIQTCIANALQGKTLAPDDEKLTALAVHIDGRYGSPGK